MINAQNLVSFFDLKPETAKENIFVVDRGFEGCEQEVVTLIAPKGKNKTKVSNKAKIARAKLVLIVLSLAFETLLSV